MDSLFESYKGFVIDKSNTSSLFGGAGNEPFCTTDGENYDFDGCSSTWSDNTEDGLLYHLTDNQDEDGNYTDWV